MSAIEVATDDRGVRTITLADEANRNALGPEVLRGLLDAYREADADDAVRVVVVTNRGSVFCAGANLAGRDEAALAGTYADMAAIVGHVARSPKPYVGRIAGHCVAGGMGLAAALDLSIAVEDAKFGFTEVRVGVAPAIISVACLPKMRAADARRAFLRGERFSAHDAVAYGLINECVPAASLDATVEACVTDLLAGGPNALATTKQLLARVPQLDTDAAFAWTTQLSSQLFAGDEAKAGVQAFLDKRPAPWAI